LSRGSAPSLYGFVFAFLFGRLLQAASVHKRFHPAVGIIGLLFCLLPTLLLVGFLMMPLL
jgi:hypothetical protein